MSIDDPTNTAKKSDTITEADLAREPTSQSDADSVELRRAEKATPPVPALALRSDGKTLLSLTYLEGADLAGREHWIGVALTEAEEGDMRSRVSGACDDAAANIAATILRKHSTPKQYRRIHMRASPGAADAGGEDSGAPETPNTP